MISKRFEDNGLTGDSIIYADSAEPKSIRELEDLGWNVLPAEKGPDSVRTGVLDLIDREVHYTEDSEDIATESQEYMWRLDKNKEPLNEPEDKNNHAMDAIRYAVYTDDNQPFFGFT
jgi:phage terminase large subunit